MKNNRLFLNKIIVFSLVLVSLFAITPKSYAQTDQGWSEPVNLSLSGSASKPILVKDFKGTFHAIWIDEIAGYKYSQSADGVSWTAPVAVLFPFGPQDPPPMLLADEKGLIHLFWIDSEGALFYGQTTPLDFANPLMWRTTTRLARGVVTFDIEVDFQGVLHVVYLRNVTIPGIPAGIYYLQSIIGGGYWSDTTLLYASEYFRALKQNQVFVGMDSSNSLDNQNIYITWDIRPQKRVFMAVSVDSGLTWTGIKQIKSPEDIGDTGSPFSLNVAAFDENVLLIWQVGEPSSPKCTVYSQWSDDSGESWEEVTAVLGGSSECPQSTRLIVQEQGDVIALLVGQVNSAMVAWNGERWSEVQAQTQLPTFLNPLTFDVVLLGCRYDLISENRLYVVGCDQGQGKDIWFISRSLEPVEKWFSPSSVWGEPGALFARSKEPEKISYFSSTTDNAGNVHAAWVQSSVGEAQTSTIDIEYAKWNGREEWTTPIPIMELSNVPLQLSLNADLQERLLLAWVDGNSGDLLFTWANRDRATLKTEWAEPKILPSPSQINSSPDIVTDASGRIVVVYVVPVNEDRGVYIVQSTDIGNTGSAPVKVFDSTIAGWEKVEQPKICLSADGVLHLIFIRNTLRVGQSVGLYYSRSINGGATWSDAQALSNGSIQWADIVCNDEQTVHVLWQEYDGLVFANLSQVSQNNGETWDRLNNITGVNNSPSPVAVATDGRGLLRFVQMVEKSDSGSLYQKNIVLQDWDWNGTNWNLDTEKELIIRGNDINYSLSANITTAGFFGIFLSTDYSKLVDGVQAKIFTIGRFISDIGEEPDTTSSIIPTPILDSSDPVNPILKLTTTPDPNVLNDNSATILSMQRNLAGIVIVGIGVIVVVFILLWRRPLNKKK